MNLREGVRLLAVGVTMALVCPASASSLDARETPTVLLLFSMRSTAPSLPEFEASFRGTLEGGLGRPVDLQVEFLDLPDVSSARYGDRLADLLREKYVSRRLDVVVVSRLEGLQFVLKHRQTLLPDVPVVFGSVTRKGFESLGAPPSLTGVIQNLEGQRTVEVAISLHPQARRVVLVCGSAPSDRAHEALARRLVTARAPSLEVLSLAGLPLDDQLRRVGSLSAEDVVVFVSYRADSLGRSMVAGEVAELVARASSAPVYGAARAWLGRGVVGGDVGDDAAEARALAAITLRILKGEPPHSIAPVEHAATRLMFDWRQLRRWGIDERRLPPGSVVLFREATLWSEHRVAVLTGIALVLGQAALILGLLFQRRRRIAAQRELADAELRYRTIADFTYDWEYWQRPDGTLAYVSPSCLRLTGYEAAELLCSPGLIDEIVLPEDRPAWRSHSDLALAGGESPGLEFRIRRKAGELVWIDHICRPVLGEDGTFLGVRGSNRDVTQKRRSEQELREALAEVDRLRSRLEADNTYLREQVEPAPGLGGIVGRSDVVRYVLARIQQVAPTASTVLLQGETGVGKELVAHAIHNLSPRKARPLVKLNCAALAPSLVESELFGHEKGAFTGALAQRKGRFEIASGTTLFLDEIGELPLELQAKLLRVIQDGEFERLGGTTTLTTDVRLVAATNRQLDGEVKAGRFREDLWYRLNVFPITVPPLRQRRDDIPALVQHFLEKHCRRNARPLLQVSEATLEDLLAHSWPGNVRELEAVVERAVITSEGPTLRLTPNEPALPRQPAETSRPPSAAGGAQPEPARPTDRVSLSEIERDHILATLERTFWRIEGEEGAAAQLGMKPGTLRSRMQKHGIRRPGSRPPKS